MYGRAPAEADLQRFLRSTPPTVHQMILKLEEKGLISRVPGEARSVKLLVGREEIPRLNRPEARGVTESFAAGGGTRTAPTGYGSFP